MPEFNNMRFNENLLGRLIAAKRTGNIADEDYTNNTSVKVQSTIKPEIKFKSCADWINTMKEDARLLTLLHNQRIESETTMNANLKHYNNWLEAKFKIN